jgi:predicted nucleic acid-binding protein
MSTVFLDTVGLLAIWDTSDQWHTSASAAFAKIVASRCRLVTTGYVLLECGNAASRKPFRPAINRLRREIKTKGQLFDPSEDELETAWATYFKGAVGSAGIVDLVSFAVMRRLNIVDVFTTGKA